MIQKYCDFFSKNIICMKGSTRNPDHEKGFFFIREVILKCEKKMPTNLNFEVGFCSKIFINHEKNAHHWFKV